MKRPRPMRPTPIRPPGGSDEQLVYPIDEETADELRLLYARADVAKKLHEAVVAASAGGAQAIMDEFNTTMKAVKRALGIPLDREASLDLDRATITLKENETPTPSEAPA